MNQVVLQILKSKYLWGAALVIGIPAFYASSGTTNALENLISSPEIIYEEIVPASEVVFGGMLNTEPSTSLEMALFREVPKLLNFREHHPGWEAILKVYKKTLKGMTPQTLRGHCRDLLTISSDYLTRHDYLRKREAAMKFCSFPRRVKEKLTANELYEWRGHSSPSKAIQRKVNKDVPNMDLKSYCSWLANSYTVHGEVTLEEVEFIKSCYSVNLK